MFIVWQKSNGIEFSSNFNYNAIFRFIDKFNHSNCLPIKYMSILKLSKSENNVMICQIQETDQLPKEFREAQRDCSNSCDTIEYHTQVMPWLGFVSDPRRVELYYYFKSNYEVVKKEFLMCETVDWIGSVGGTLGLFIGFSFLGRIIELFDFLKKFLLNVTSIN